MLNITSTYIHNKSHISLTCFYPDLVKVFVYLLTKKIEHTGLRDLLSSCAGPNLDGMRAC